jgi:hypothetical protein
MGGKNLQNARSGSVDATHAELIDTTLDFVKSTRKVLHAKWTLTNYRTQFYTECTDSKLNSYGISLALVWTPPPHSQSIEI